MKKKKIVLKGTAPLVQEMVNEIKEQHKIKLFDVKYPKYQIQKTPLHIIAGEFDFVTPLSQARYIMKTQAVKKKKLYRVQRRGHACLFDDWLSKEKKNYEIMMDALLKNPSGNFLKSVR